jgi:hypothetical protein
VGGLRCAQQLLCENRSVIYTVSRYGWAKVCAMVGLVGKSRRETHAACRCGWAKVCAMIGLEGKSRREAHAGILTRF